MDPLTMRLIGLMCVRSEDWIVGASARAALSWVDALIILDHASTDATQDILAQLQTAYGAGRVRCLFSNDTVWPEMAHRQRMLEAARDFGATHLALIDADEIVTSPWAMVLRDLAKALRPSDCLELWMVPVWGDLTHFRDDDSVWSRAHLTLIAGDAPHLNWMAEHDGYCHHSRAPRGLTRIHRFGSRDVGGIMHLQFVNRRRLLAKHVWYRMMEHVRWPGRTPIELLNQKYDQALMTTGMQLSPLPSSWLETITPLLDRYLVLDSKPWHENDIAAMLSRYGRNHFAGLNLHGF